MATLNTKFAGLTLKNPFIVSSSGLTDSAAKNKKHSDAGAGAIVLKSLFEEQIRLEAGHLEDYAMYPEGSEYLSAYIREHKLSEYLTLIKESRQACDCPIIASINCYDDSDWVDFARQIEQAGADALEINILALQTDADYTYGAFEQRHIDILRHVKKTIGIPVIVKLGSNLTNPVALINQLKANGAGAVVLFNRFYQPDIDINKLVQTSGSVLSHESELSTTLRWVGIASAVVKTIDYAASGGIHTPEGIVKALLAGASAVEVCSVLYQHHAADFIAESLSFLAQWMDSKGFQTIDQFKGRLNLHELSGVNTFERTQFLKYFATHQ